jgi:NAD(P)-dependent dehydrogenase (short-subunit alcohol dehydrogenase family)
MKEKSIMIYMNDVFSGKRALVVGGSGGIGAAISVKLAAMGAEVLVHGGHSEEKLSQTLMKIREQGGKAEGFIYPADQNEAAEAILAKFPSPDILVCAWGPFLQQSLAEMKTTEWEYIIRNNLIFPSVLVSLVLHDMIRKDWGRIILFGGTNTSTIRGFSTSAAYSAAKTALGVLAKSAAIQVGTANVTCNVICPGLVETEYVNDTMKDYIKNRSPAGKIETPADIAEFIAAILPLNQINGAVIPVDFGLQF